MNTIDQIQKPIQEEILKLQGPILVLGAGGFIGANMMLQLLKYRKDVYGVTTQSFIPWRLDNIANEYPDNLIVGNLLDKNFIADIFEKYHFQTIFNFAAYGAYSKQKEEHLIYETNVIGLLNILLVSSAYHIRILVHAGTSSEYGINCEAPKEDDICIPNSHYAVSKVAAANLIKYYGTVLEYPVVNLRYYSIYGPFEEPDRLIPQLIEKGINHTYPNLVQPNITRDFVYIDDAILATLKAANSKIETIRGQSINIATGKKTSIKDVAEYIQKLFHISSPPIFGDFPNRKWDLENWFGNTQKAKNLIHWESTISLIDGLLATATWKKEHAKILYEKKNFQDQIKHSITAIIACYKDAQAIPIMYERLTKIFKKLNVHYEIIFVNDCSPDNTSEVLQKIIDKDRYVIGIEHSRNFGSQSAFLSGMEIATTDMVVLLDGDLQDPPEMIEQFYEQWKKGWEVVYGRRVKREGIKILIWCYKIFYKLFRKMSYVPIPLDAGDFSLMDKKVYTELIKLPETDQFLRGLRAWIGFKQIGVDYMRPERMFGKTTNNWRKNIAWARKGIYSFSFVPLELLSYAGWILTIIASFAIIAQIILYFVMPNIPHGISTIIVLILFLGGFSILGISILGEYQAKILEEVKKRPKFIRKKIIKNQHYDNTHITK